MNERKFLKAINNKNNVDGAFTYFNVCELIEKMPKALIPKKQSIFSKIFYKLRRTKSTKEILADNFETIMLKTSDYYVDILICTLIKNSETVNIIQDKFDLVLNRLNLNKLGSYQAKQIFTALKGIPNGNEFLNRKIDTILENININYLFAVSQCLKGLSEEADNKLNNVLENNKVQIARSILDECTLTRVYDIKNREKLLDDYSKILAIMIDELLESEKTKFIDIKPIGCGSYSNVYQIGGKILKVGGPRRTYNIPNHSRILQPLIRTNLIDENDGNKLFACIEISEKIDKLEKEDFQEEKLYELYKELRRDGIIWTDVKFNNVGKLNKPNEPSLNGEVMDVSPDSIGFDVAHKGTKSNIGDLVILDTDFLYKQEDSDIFWQSEGIASKFEKRYQQEVANEIAKSFANKKAINNRSIPAIEEH